MSAVEATGGRVKMTKLPIQEPQNRSDIVVGRDDAFGGSYRMDKSF